MPVVSAERGATIQRVGHAVLARTDVGARLVERIVDEVPVYRRARRELLDDVLVLATATAELLGQALAAGAPIRREDVPLVREHAARRMHQGISLDAFLHAYRAALFGYWDICADEASRLGISRDDALALARFALDAIDTLTTHAAEAYLREETRVRTQSGREARDLLERLIRGDTTETDRRDPAAAGLDPAGRIVTIVGRVDGAPLAVGDALAVVRDALEQALSVGRIRPLVGIRQGEIVLVVAGEWSRDKVARLRTARRRAMDEHAIDIRYGLSIASAGFASVQRAYREAVLSLSYTSASRPIVSLTDLSSLECALAGADPATRSVIASKGAELQNMAEADRVVAAATITAFAAADLNVAETARALHVHPNTVRYRLERLAATTGHDPRTFTGLVELVCVLEIADDQPGTRDRSPDRSAP